MSQSARRGCSRSSKGRPSTSVRRPGRCGRGMFLRPACPAGRRWPWDVMCNHACVGGRRSLCRSGGMLMTILPRSQRTGGWENMTLLPATASGSGSIWSGAGPRPSWDSRARPARCRPEYDGIERHDEHVCVLSGHPERRTWRRIAISVRGHPGRRDIGPEGARTGRWGQRSLARPVSDFTGVLGGQRHGWKVGMVQRPRLLGGGDVGVLEAALSRGPPAAGRGGVGPHPQRRSEGTGETRDLEVLAEGQPPAGRAGASIERAPEPHGKGTEIQGTVRWATRVRVRDGAQRLGAYE